MISCPCCSDNMLRHIRSNRMYFFCPSCWQEMPHSNTQRDCSLPTNRVMELAIGQQKRTLAKV